MRRIIAVFTAALLLLCQTAALAQLCATPTSGEIAAALTMPCHGDGAGDASSQPAPSWACEAAQGLAEIAKVPIFSFPAQPVLVIASRDAAQPLNGGLHVAVQAVCSSPPLTVLHCRFLN